MVNFREDKTACLGVVTAESIFWQADVDGDNLLSPAEFLFASHISDEAKKMQKWRHDEAAGMLPVGYVEKIDDMFSRLGRRSRQVREIDLRWALADFLEVPPEQILEDTSGKLHQYFVIADVIRDGVLNLNELDFAHFMLRESLIEAAVVSETKRALRREKAKQHAAARAKAALARKQAKAARSTRLQKFLRKLDANHDGRFDWLEVRRLAVYFADLPRERQMVKDYVREMFMWADEDGDKILDAKEAKAFLQILAGQEPE